MKIDDPHAHKPSLPNVSKSEGSFFATSGRTKPATTTESSSGDSVNLNDISRIFTQAQTAGLASQAAKIQHLRHLFATGQLNTDSQELSGSIIDAHLNGG